jgi:hypothetical protein
MSIPGLIPITDSRPTIAGDLGRYALWVVWQSIRERQEFCVIRA